MSWQAIGVLVALLGVVGTLGLNLRSQRLTREGQYQDRELANNAASRSEAAARLTEEYTRRVVDALEAIAMSGGLSSGLATTTVRWRLVKDRGDTYRLTNIGNAVAATVEVSSHKSLGVTWLYPPPTELQPDEAVIFLAAVTFGTTDLTITVSWTQDGIDGPQSWRYPLPLD